MTAPRVFISYSHDSAEHMERVLALSDRLRKNGVDCSIDQYVDAPEEGWPTWMATEIKHADFVLVVCTAEYQRRFDPKHSDGAGSRFESVLIVQQLHNARMRNKRFVPVLLGDASPTEILEPLQPYSHYRVDTELGFEALLRHLLKRPAITKPALGDPPSLPSRTPPERNFARGAGEAQDYRCQAPHPGADFVHRGELDTMIERLTTSTDDTTTASTLAITTALQGAGGFGKTTLAQALCHHERVQEAFPDGVLWVVMGEGLDDAGRIRSILDSVRLWTNANPPAFESAAAAGTHLRSLVDGRRVLVVVDDIWQRSDARPFVGLGSGSALLITTRNRDTLPPGTLPLDVDEMEPSEAVQLLGVGLGGQSEDFEPLAHQLGEWPLLLKLVNGQLRELRELGFDRSEALGQVEERLRKRGLEAFDRHNPEERVDAVRWTMAVGFEAGILSDDEKQRYLSLAIFPEDTDIPIEVLAPFWGIELLAALRVCKRLFDRSLLLRMDRHTIRLHDVFRQYLIGDQGSRLVELNHRFLKANRPGSGRWSDLPPSAGYLWRHLAHHLIGAGEASLLASMLLDFDFLRAKLEALDLNSLLGDIAKFPENPGLKALAGALRLSAHVLFEDPGQLACQLMGRLREVGELSLDPLLDRAQNSQGLNLRRGTLTPPGGPLLRTLTGHTQGVLAIELLRDGRVVSGSKDGTLRVWNMESGECEHMLSGHVKEILAVDGLGSDRLVSASADATLRVWDAKSGECETTLSGHTKAVLVVQGLETDRIVSGSRDGTLRVWNLDSCRGKGGYCEHILEGHSGEVRIIKSLENGRIVSASSDGSLRIWDAASGSCEHVLAGHADKILGVEVLNRDCIVSASADGVLRVWSVGSGACEHTLAGHTDSVLGVVHLDGGWVASASADGTVRIWDVVSGDCKRVIASLTSFTLTFECTERYVISSQSDGTIRVWEIPRLIRLEGLAGKVLRGHEDGVRAVRSLGDGRAVSASLDGTLRVWDLSSMEPWCPLSGSRTLASRGHTSWVLAFESLEDGRLVSASYDGTLRVWDPASGECVFALMGHSAGVLAVERLDEERIVSASYDGTLSVWDVSNSTDGEGTCEQTLEGHTDWVRAVVRLGPGRIASASRDGTVRVWGSRALSGGASECDLTLLGHKNGVRAVTYLDERWLVSASEDSTLRVWDIESGVCEQTLSGHTAEIRAIEDIGFGRVVSASDDGTLRVWNVSSGICERTLVGHTDGIRVIERVGAGRVVSGSLDGTLRVWDVTDGSCERILQGHTDWVLAIEDLGADRVASTSYDGTLRIWNLEDGSTSAVFTGESALSALLALDSHSIVAGDAAGRVHFLDLVEPEPPNAD